jgi:glycosyltransferase involved in cell wall biosynthesis
MSKPIITTKTAGCRETVDEGKNGFLVEVKNVNSLIDGLEKFLNLSNESIQLMGKHSRVKVEKEFENSIIAENFYNIISPF